MRITTFLRQHPKVVFVPYVFNLGLYVWLLVHGAHFKGIFISGLLALGGLWFIFLCVRAGFVMGGGSVEAADRQPFSFWASMIVCFGIYIFITAGAIGLYLQDIGYLTYG